MAGEQESSPWVKSQRKTAVKRGKWYRRLEVTRNMKSNLNIMAFQILKIQHILKAMPLVEFPAPKGGTLNKCQLIQLGISHLVVLRWTPRTSVFSQYIAFEKSSA